MSQRISEDAIRSFLTWGRNYGEIASFKKLAGGGRCWRIELPADLWAHSDDGPMFAVPSVFILTSREALAFGYGLAAAGARERRSDFAKREWDW